MRLARLLWAIYRLRLARWRLERRTIMRRRPRGHRGRGIRFRPAAQPFHKAYQAHGRPFLGVVMGLAPSFVGRPVHEPWPGGKLPEEVVLAVAQPHADSPGASIPPLVARFQLARVAQSVAVATSEHGLDDVQPDDPTAAVPALEPRTLAAEPARRPDGSDTLLAAPAARRYGVMRLPERRWLKVAIPTPVQRVDVPAALNEPLAAARRAPHLPLPFRRRIIEIAWQVLVLRGYIPVPTTYTRVRPTTPRTSSHPHPVR